MKHLILFLLLLPFIVNAQTYKEVRIHSTPGNIRFLAGMGLAMDEGIYRDGIWTGVLSESEVGTVTRAGFTVDVIRSDYTAYISARNQEFAKEIEEINRMIRSGEYISSGTKNAGFIQYPVPVHFELGGMGGYYTPDQVLNELDSMRQFFPNLISQKIQMGNNLTIGGRTQYYVRISNTPNTAAAKPRIFYNALIHAREPIGMQQMMFFMWYLLENYTTNADVKYLVDHLEMYFAPLINPDGYAYNYQISPGGGGLWRKNRRDNGGGAMGVDLNRNFGFMWGYDNQGSSPDPNDETYRGLSAFSEAETQNFQTFCGQMSFKAAVNFHSYADETLYPFCYETMLTPDSLTEYAFTDRFTAENGYVTGTPGNILYNTNGDAMDWEYGDQVSKPKIISFTTEIGTGYDGFWPIPSRIIPLCQENMYANLTIAKLTLPYAEITDLGPVINPLRDGWMPFLFQRIGLTDSIDYIISIKPLDTDLFASVGSPKTIHFPGINVNIKDSIQYSLKPGIQIGQPYRFIWEINTGMTILRDTITKYYGWPRVLLADSCNTMENWTSTGWGNATKAYHSAPKSLADSPNGPYVNGANNSVMLKNGLPALQSPIAVVEYWLRYSIEKSMDYCRVVSSPDDGSTWNYQPTRYTNHGSIGQNFPNPIYDGNRNWSQDRFVIGNTSGGKVQVKFTLRSDANGMIKDGMYIDDFRVTAIDMTYNDIDPTGEILGFISDPMPNPASDAVSVRYQLAGADAASGKSTITSLTASGPEFILTNMQGVIIRSDRLPSASGTYKFSAGTLPPGIYLYRIRWDGGATAVKKLLVVH